MEWISVIPFLVVIPVALWTKQVIPGLTLGLIIGSYLKEPSLIGGISKMLEYIIKSLTEKNNIEIILFLYLFSGLVEIIKITGGIKGFVEIIAKKIKTNIGLLLLTWISTIGTFSAPTFRIVTITPIMKALLQQINVTSQELGFMIEITSTPIIVLVPMATAFIGYMTSIIDLALSNQNITQDSYLLFIKSIPFNFFAILILIFGFYLSFFHKSEDKDMSLNQDKDEDEDEDWHDCHPVVSKDLPTKPWNLLIPIILTISLTIFLSWWDGHLKSNNFLEAFLKADVLKAMVIAIVSTVLLSFIFYLGQGFSLTKLVSHFIIGGNELMKIIFLLTVVWSLTIVTEELGFSTFITNNMDWLSGILVPPILFLIGCVISYFIGSSWGTWGILMPLAISLAHISGTYLPLIIGSVFAGGTFGAFASPLSGNTITIAKILDLPLMKYTAYKIKPALIVAGIATILYFISAFIW